jgi:hypothetical protein
VEEVGSSEKEEMERLERQEAFLLFAMPQLGRARSVAWRNKSTTRAPQ